MDVDFRPANVQSEDQRHGLALRERRYDQYGSLGVVYDAVGNAAENH